MLACFTSLSSEFLEMLFQIPYETLKIMHLFETYNCLANSSLKSGTVLRQRWFYQKRLPASPVPLSPEDMCSKMHAEALRRHHHWQKTTQGLDTECIRVKSLPLLYQRYKEWNYLMMHQN